MNKCNLCGAVVEGRYVCKGCEGKVTGNLNTSRNPCYHCPRRARNCHKTCKDYNQWVNNHKAVKDIIFRQNCLNNDVYIVSGGKERYR